MHERGKKKQNRIKGTTFAVLCDFSFLPVSQLTSQQRCNLQKARAEEEKKKMVTKVEKWLEKRGRVEEKPGVSSGLASKSGDSLNEF